MRKSSFGFNSRLSSGPLRVKNDGGGGGGGGLRKSSAGSHTPQAYSGASTYSSASTSRTRSVIAGHGGRGNNGQGRYSGIGAAGSNMRFSTIGARGRTDVAKDPRPLSDKTYQHRCIRTLIDFLSESKYPHPLSPKLLQSPPSKEFFRIFEFISFQLLDPNFRLSSKPEEDIPRTLKALGYPFSISKSSMHAVGTPHTWPTLLAALIWMIDLCKVIQSVTDSQVDQPMFPPEDEDFDSVPESKIKFDDCARTYSAYLAGMDDFDDFDKELDKVLENKFLGQSGGIEAIVNENARIAEEIDLLDQEKIRADKFLERREIMLLDERKLRDYMNELENVKRKYHTQLAQAEDEHSSLVQEMRSVQSKNQEMQKLYEQQDLTLADVERLRAARQELQRTEESLEKEVEAIDSDIWKEEMGLARIMELVDSILGEYSRLARALQLIPSTTPVANGINYELRSSDRDFVHKFELIKPALMALKTKGREVLQQLEARKRDEECAVEQTAEQRAELEREVSQLEKGVKDMDEEIRCRKELYKGDIDHLQNTIDRLKEEIRAQQMSDQMNLQDSERQLRDTLAWSQQKEAEMKKKEDEYADALCSICTMISDHKMHVQEQLKQLEMELKQALAQEQTRLKRMQETSKEIRQQYRDISPH